MQCNAMQCNAMPCCTCAGIETLGDVAQLSFLRSLSLACNAIRDVGPLAALPGLLELDLRDNDM
jgi:Leucine-rich repeat (LRR) protein